MVSNGQWEEEMEPTLLAGAQRQFQVVGMVSGGLSE